MPAQRWKRLEGRDEAILDPGLPIVDAHHHLYEQPAIHYMHDDYLADVRAGHRIVASVYVESQQFARPDGPPDLRPLGEVEFANGVGAMGASGVYGDCRFCAAVVGHADMRGGDAVAGLLDAALAAAPGRFRGVRQITVEHPTEAPFRQITHRPPAGVLRSNGFPLALRQLARRGLSFDAAVLHHQLPALAAAIDLCPEATIVLNHMGMAMAMELGQQERSDVFRQWQAGLRDLARRPNVFCKVGGLGLATWGLGFDQRADPIGYLELAGAWRPYVETAIEAFGADRCLMESNFPPDGRSCGYVPLWNAMKHITRHCSPAERASLFQGTAARVYRLELPPAPGS